MQRTLCYLSLSCAVLEATADGRGFCKDDPPQYSGYLRAGPTEAEYFYYLASSRSATPESDPLVLWLTGGPGCSSVLALLMENGPCGVKGKAEDGTWEMKRNPYSWTEAANVLWVDQPVGVGYSSPTDHLVYTEAGVADRMLLFLQNFYKKYPHFHKVPLFITGESYGGHYVPSVAVKILHDQSVGTLAGVAIGNGLVDPLVQWQTKPVMAYSGGAGMGGSLKQGVVNLTTYLQMNDAMPQCQSDIKECLAFRKPMDCAMSMQQCGMTEIVPVQATGKNPYDLRIDCQTKPDPKNPASGLCYDTTKEFAFLNDNATKRKLGVPAERHWISCNTTSSMPFIFSGDEMVDYRRDARELLNAGVHVVIYAGDTDFMVDWLGCRAWLEQLPWPHRDEWLQAPFEPVSFNGEEIGRQQSAYGLTFIQVYNAGHLVPQDQPAVALAILRGMINQPFTRTVGNFVMSFVEMTQPSFFNAATATLAAMSLALAFFVAVYPRTRAGQKERGASTYYLMA